MEPLRLIALALAAALCGCASPGKDHDTIALTPAPQKTSGDWVFVKAVDKPQP